MRRAYDELVGMSDTVMKSGLDWTIVRFLAPKDGPAKGNARHGFYGQTKLGFNVTRSDIAAFTAAQVDDRQYVGHAPGISNWSRGPATDVYSCGPAGAAPQRWMSVGTGTITGEEVVMDEEDERLGPSPAVVEQLRRKTLTLPVPEPTAEDRDSYRKQLASLGATPDVIARLTDRRRRRRRLSLWRR
jgi:hypothetical protein